MSVLDNIFGTIDNAVSVGLPAYLDGQKTKTVPEQVRSQYSEKAAPVDTVGNVSGKGVGNFSVAGLGTGASLLVIGVGLIVLAVVTKKVL